MSSIRIVALGGLDEDGKNLYCIDIDGRIIIVNAGLKLPEDNQYGIKYIVPDFNYLEENSDRIVGVILTHAHDDMMNGLGQLLLKVDVPVYGPEMCRRVLKHILKPVDWDRLNYHVVGRNEQFKVGEFDVTSFALTHATPDAIGIAIETENGQIVVAEQFVIDFDMHDRAFDSDISTIAEIGKKGVLALLMEASYAGNNFFTAPKHRVYEMVKPFFEDAKGRIIVTIYNQNYFRIKEIINLAREFKRSVFFYDERLKTRLKDMDELGYYSVPRSMEVPREKFSNDIEDIVILVTETGGHIFNLMNRIATGEDETIELKDSDTIIIASPVVSGTEKRASAMENELYKDGVTIHKLSGRDVLSLHPSSEDMKMMLYLLKPKYFIPVMGEYRNFIQAANLALQVGFTPDRVIILDNGQVATINGGSLISCSEMIEVGETLIGDDTDRNITSFVLKDRETLSTDGVIIIGVAIDYNTKKVIGGPDIQSRGVIYVKDSEYVIRNIGTMVVDLINDKVADGTYENMAARAELRENVARYVLRETGKRPMILPAILEINLK